MTPPNQPRQYRQQSAGVSGIGYLIFFSRWLQAPLYLGLIVAQLIYVWVFVKELWHLGDEVINHSARITEATVMLGVLGLIDVVMISNLLIMAIIGISSIHLLKSFIEVGDIGAPSSEEESITGDVYTSEGVFWQVIIHAVFILSAIALAWIDRMSGGTRTVPELTVGHALAIPISASVSADREAQALHYEQLARELRS